MAQFDMSGKQDVSLVHTPAAAVTDRSQPIATSDISLITPQTPIGDTTSIVDDDVTLTSDASGPRGAFEWDKSWRENENWNSKADWGGHNQVPQTENVVASTPAENVVASTPDTGAETATTISI